MYFTCLNSFCPEPPVSVKIPCPAFLFPSVRSLGPVVVFSLPPGLHLIHTLSLS